MTKTLHEVMNGDLDKVSDKWSSYIPFYQKHFAHLQDMEVNVLEIGVQNGGSLEVWSKFFQKAKKIVGCEINEKCRDLKYDDGRISVVIGNATEKKTAAEIKNESPKFDVIIDDGSHTSEDIIKTFSIYFPMLNPGGLYVVEDLHASYFGEYQGGTEAPFSSMNFFKRLTDYVNIEHWKETVESTELLKYYEEVWNVKFTNQDIKLIKEVSFENSIVVVKKSNSNSNCIGTRCVVGNNALVHPNIKTLNGKNIKPRSDHENPFGGCSEKIEYRATLPLNPAKDTSRTLNECKDNLIRAYKRIEEMEEEITLNEKNRLSSFVQKATYLTLKTASKMRPLVTKKAAKRFRKSAEKRNPNSPISNPVSSDALLTIIESGFWDETWYKSKYSAEIESAAELDKRVISPLHHYVLYGWKKGYDPSQKLPFRINKKISINPISHFVHHVACRGYQFEENIWHPEQSDVQEYLRNRAIKKEKRIIYTCIIGHYDNLIQQRFIDQSARYVCFTDREDLLKTTQLGIWEIRPIVKECENAGVTNRWHKMHPDHLFPECDESIYIDGNINIRTNYLNKSIDHLDSDICLPRHFERDCILEEIEAIYKKGKINTSQKQSVDEILKGAMECGFPKNWGLSENNVIYRRHHNAKVKSIMRDWWHLTQTVAPRDQAHLTHLLWKHGFCLSKITFENTRHRFKDFAVIAHRAP